MVKLHKNHPVMRGMRLFPHSVGGAYFDVLGTADDCVRVVMRAPGSYPTVIASSESLGWDVAIRRLMQELGPRVQTKRIR